MKSEVVYLFVIVNVIDFDFKAFLLFKVVIDRDLGYEVWIQSVMNNFCLPDLGPNISLGFKQHQKRIRKTKSISVR